MYRLKRFFRRIFTPITIMFIPHSSGEARRIKVPLVGIVVSVVFWVIGSVYVISIINNAFQYEVVKEKLDYYAHEFLDLKNTITTLRKTEHEFRELVSFKSKEEVLENLDVSDTGSLIDIENLKEQIRVTMENVAEIKDYLSQERDIYFATPKGLPVEGETRFTSSYGYRQHPVSGRKDFHSGMDIASGPGVPIVATADGIVTFAGWSGGNGNLVVLEHGYGYSTFYAHNKKVAVKVGQQVKRGDVISYMGSTGSSTGPHVHYEVWKDGKPVNPYSFIKGKGRT